MTNVLVFMYSVLSLVLIAQSFGSMYVEAQVDHVVGEDPGWDLISDLASWSKSRTFMVGDKIWFAYSASEGTIAELRSREEYESCDAQNPIRTYTDGLESIELEGEGVRYFVSSKLENCNKGLKLNVEVVPRSHLRDATPTVTIAKAKNATVVAADGPSTPSASAAFRGSWTLSLIGLLLFLIQSW